MKKLAILLSAVIGSAAAAQAQTSVFDGHWRIVAAEPAAWSAERNTPAPLLRSGMIFREGTALLPPRAFCDKPQRSESWIPSRWLLGGEMSGQTLRAFYRRHGITEGANLNGMVLTCGDQETRLVLAEEGRALLAHEGWVYTLRRRQGVLETQNGKPGGDAAFLERANAGFDCGRAASTVERLTCGYPDALEADAAMARAYEALRVTLGPAAGEALKRAQTAFNEDRALSCGAQGYMPKDMSLRGDMERCLAEVTAARAAYLGSLAPASAGPLRIEPHLATATRRKKPGRNESWRASGWIAQDARPVLTGATPEVTRAFDRILRDEAGYGQPLIPPNQDFEGGRERSYVVHGLDERFASLLVTTRSDTGTSTPPAIVAINVDLRTGRSVRLDAILDVTRAGFAEALATAIGDQAQDGAYLAANRDAIASGEESIWAFAEDKAIVSWRLGGGAPPEEVEIPATALAPFLKANSPWRPKSTANSHQPVRR